MTNESEETTHSAIDKAVRATLPNFPDENTSPYWIWPPLTGYDILQTVLKHTLRPRPRKEGMWVLAVQDEWRCFSKTQWHYTDTHQAHEAFHAQIRLHLQGSPVLSTQRCIAVAQGRRNKWYLWQIVHEESSLATHLITTLQKTKNIIALTDGLLKWLNQYVTIYQQCNQYPIRLDLNLDNVGIDNNRSFIYLGPVEEGESSTTVTTNGMMKQIIKQVFTIPILQNLSVQTNLLKRTLKDKQSTKQDIVLETLLELLSDIEES